MSRLPRWAPQQKVNGEDLNLLAAALDAGGFLNLQSASSAQTTGQGLVSTVPASPGSTTPPPGTQGAPSTPTGLTVSYGIDNYSQTHDAYVLLTWTPNPVTDYVARYDIYWHKGSDPNLHNLSVGGDVTAARINSLIPGLSYLFAIQAHDAAGRVSNWSMEIPITISLDVDPPAIPTGLAATAIGTGINLTWTEVGTDGISKDLKQYQLAISTDGGGTFPTIRTIGPGNSYFYNPGLGAFSSGNAPTFVFKIASVDWTGNISAYSATASATLNSSLTIDGELEITNGSNSSSDTIAQIEMGWSGGAPIPVYQQWISTRHNAGALALNQIKFWTSDGTQFGTFPTNAVLGLTIDGSTGVTVAKDLTANARIVLTTTSSKIVPGATSLSIRNNADSADNLLITDAGNATFRGFLSVTPTENNWMGIDAQTNVRLGMIKRAGNLPMIASDSTNPIIFVQSNQTGIGTNISGATLTELFRVDTSALTMTSGAINGPANFGIASTAGDMYVSANSSNTVIIRPSRGSATGQSLFSSTLVTLSLPLAFSQASAKIIPGATNISHRNNADSADNLLIADAGAITTRNALSIPPSASGTVAASNYGSVPVKISEQVLGADTTTVTFSSIPGGFRHLMLYISVRSDQATTAQEFRLRFNSDSTAGHYTLQRLTVAGATITGQDGGTVATAFNKMFMPGTSTPLGTAAKYQIQIIDYAETNWTKTVRADGLFYSGATQPLANVTSYETMVGQWNNAVAVTQLDLDPLTGKFKINSVFTLYGIP